MRVTIIRDDGIVGVNGVFRKVDLTGLPAGVRAVQWNETEGHVEYDAAENATLNAITQFQPFIDRWIKTQPPMPRPKTTAELIKAAHARINEAYENAIFALTAGYPPNEIASWDKQEAEARAWLADNSTPTPWIDGAAGARNIPKPEFVAKVIAQANALAPVHGALSGKRQLLRDQINALINPTPEQLNAIKW